MFLSLYLLYKNFKQECRPSSRNIFLYACVPALEIANVAKFKIITILKILIAYNLYACTYAYSNTCTKHSTTDSPVLSLQVVGIDPDSERLQVACKKYSADNVCYFEGSGENIFGGDYDIVFSNSVLHWCKDKNLVFKNVAKSLKPGGTFGFVTPADFDFEKHLFTPAKMFSQECHRALVNNIFHATSETYLSVAAANSLKVTHFSKHLREWKFEDVSELVEFYMTHYKGQFGPEHFNVEAMEDHYGRDYVGFTIPYITVVAHKD